MPYHVPDLAGFLTGRWRIERRIVDPRSGLVGRLTGEALFASAPDGLRYDERGTLAFGVHRGEAGRSYRFTLDRPGGASGAAGVYFEDGHFFHRLDLSCGRADVVHDCAPDCDRGRYRVAGRDRWMSSWLVRGPRKRVLIGTRYARDAASAAVVEGVRRLDGLPCPAAAYRPI